MLYRYVKAEVKRPEITINTNYFFHKQNKKIYGVSVFTLMTGLGILFYSFYPYLSSFYVEYALNNSYGKSVLTANDEKVLGETASKSFNLNSGYLNNVSKNFESTNRALGLAQKTHPELASFTGTMLLNIPRLNAKNTPVAVNVDSYDEKLYMPTLETKLAHFKGTSLPGYSGNIFIYGHSTNELSVFGSPTNPKILFTRLDKIEVGDEIRLKYDDTEVVYVMQRSKVVSPNDITSIYSKPDVSSLTLMTCWPPGIGTDRLIVVAEKKN